MKGLVLLFIVYGSSFVALKAQTITTIAGNGTYGHSGDGGPATDAELSNVIDVAVDGFGNVYIADLNNSLVRIVNPTDIITTFAGNGIASELGNGGPATAAGVGWPWAVATDAFGNVYIAQAPFDIIRMVNLMDTISLFTGTGSPFGFSGDGGPPTAAEINAPHGIALDAFGNLYIADQENGRIRKISNITGIDRIKKDNSVAVYPNPSNGIFTFSFSNLKEKCNIEIYNVLGKKVLTETLRSAQGDNILDLSGNPSGIYFYRILEETGNLLGEGKLIIQE
jgi:hypothetical protein